MAKLHCAVPGGQEGGWGIAQEHDNPLPHNQATPISYYIPTYHDSLEGISH